MCVCLCSPCFTGLCSSGLRKCASMNSNVDCVYYSSIRLFWWPFCPCLPLPSSHPSYQEPDRRIQDWLELSSNSPSKKKWKLTSTWLVIEARAVAGGDALSRLVISVFFPSTEQQEHSLGQNDAAQVQTDTYPKLSGGPGDWGMYNGPELGY